MQVLQEAHESLDSKDLNTLTVLEAEKLMSEDTGEKTQLDPEQIANILKYLKSKQPGNGRQQKKRITPAKANAKRKAQKKARKKNR